MLSTITWLNRGDASDNFATAFATSPVAAETARQVVDAAILAWERTIVSFNHGDPAVAALPYELGMTISMEPGDTRCSATVSPSTVALSSEGKPYLATMRINMCDRNSIPDNIPDWFVDPTPNDHSEFMGTEADTLNDGVEVDPGPLGNAMIPHAFAGVPQPGSPANGLFDLLTLVTHEMGHAVGMTSNPASRFSTSPNISNTGIVDTATPGNNFWIYQSPTLNYLLTDQDGASGNSAVRHARLYRAGNTSFPEFSNVYGSRNLMTPTSVSFDKRQLIPNHFVQMLEEIYGYTVNEPEQFGTFHAMLNPNTGVVTVRGGNDAVSIEGSTATNSPDLVEISWIADKLIISVDVGNDMPGIGTGTTQFDRQDAYVSRFDISDVSDIVVNTYGGADRIIVFGLPNNIALTINGGAGADMIRVGGFDMDDIDGTVNVIGGDGSDHLRFADVLEDSGQVYTLDATTFRRSGGNTASYSDIELLNVDGGQGGDFYFIDGTPADSLVSIYAGGGSDIIAVGGGRLNAIRGALSINGGPQGPERGDILQYNDDEHPDGESYTVHGGSLVRSGLGLFTYTAVEDLRIQGSQSENHFEINSTAANTHLIVVGGPQNDTFEIGAGDIDSNLGNDVSIRGGGSSGLGDFVLFDDQFDDGDDEYFIEDNTFTKTGFNRTVDFEEIERVRLEGNADDNVVHVNRTPAETTFTVQAGSGNDTIQTGSGDFDSNVQGELIVIGGFGADSLVIDDSTDNVGADAYVFDATAEDGATFGKTNYAASLGYSLIESLVLNANPFDNSVNINGTSPETQYDIFGNGGDDRFTVSAPLASPVEIHGGTASDGLTIAGQEDSQGVYTPDDTTTGNGIVDVDGQPILFSGLENVNVRTFQTFSLVSPNANDRFNISETSGGRNRFSGDSSNVAITPLSFRDIDVFVVDMASNDGLAGNDELTVTAGDMVASGVNVLQVGAGTGANTLYASSGQTNVDTNFGLGGQNLDVYAINSGTELNFQSSQHLGSLWILDGAGVQMAGHGSHVMVVQSLGIAGQSDRTSTLDINDNAVIVNYPNVGSSPFSILSNQITHARNDMAPILWTGHGITSSIAAANPDQLSIGIAEAVDLFDGLDGEFFGVPLVGGDRAVLIRQTVPGDSNLDGQFNTADIVLTLLAGEYNDDIPHNSTWYDGDWNWDGDFDVLDLVAALQAGSYVPGRRADAVFARIGA